MSCLFASDDQGTRASASVLPANIQGWSLLRLTGLISLLSKGLLRVFSSTTVRRCQFFGVLPSWRSSSRYVRDHWEDHSLNHKDLCWQSNVCASRLTVELCHCFPPRKQSSSDFLATVHSDFRTQEEEICHCFHLLEICISSSSDLTPTTPSPRSSQSPELSPCAIQQLPTCYVVYTW